VVVVNRRRNLGDLVANTDQPFEHVEAGGLEEVGQVEVLGRRLEQRLGIGGDAVGEGREDFSEGGF
jgi:hypothetical protein